MGVLRLPSVTETPTIDIPVAGALFKLNRAGAYRAAKRGYLPIIKVSERRYKVPVAALREMLGLPVDGPAIDIEVDGLGAIQPQHPAAGLPADDANPSGGEER